jgi:hypothetical protein
MPLPKGKADNRYINLPLWQCSGKLADNQFIEKPDNKKRKELLAYILNEMTLVIFPERGWIFFN